MKERLDVRVNDPLIKSCDEFVKEAFDQDPELREPFNLVDNKSTKELIFELLDVKPRNDLDYRGFLWVLSAAYLGYFQDQTMLHNKDVNSLTFVKSLQNQLTEDALRWGDTWKKRTIQGQLDRTYKDFNDYKDQFENAGQEFPWLKVAGNTIICLYRLKHPTTYQK